MSKKRVSLTIDESLVEKVDAESESAGTNRSQLVETIIKSYFEQQGIDTAVILCGDTELKTLELYDGKPVLSHILDHLADEGISRVVLLIGDNKEIKDNFGSEYHGLALEYISEKKPEGTAAALQKVEDKIDGTFVTLNGHVITDVDLRDMLRAHEEADSIATMALTAVENPSNYGVARLKGRRILGFEEKPEPNEEPSRLINAGTYIFEPAIFDSADHKSLEYVFKKLANNSELSGYIYGGKWEEIEI